MPEAGNDWEPIANEKAQDYTALEKLYSLVVEERNNLRQSNNNLIASRNYWQDNYTVSINEFQKLQGEYEEKLDELSKSCDSLRQSRNNWEGGFKERGKHIDELKKEKAELEKGLERATHSIAYERNEVRYWKAAADKYRQELNNSQGPERAEANIAEDRDRLLTKNEELEKSISGLRLDNATLHKHSAELERKIEDYKQALTMAREETQKIFNEREELAKIKNISLEAEQYRQAALSAQAALIECERELAATKRTLTTINNRNSDLSLRLEGEKSRVENNYRNYMQVRDGAINAKAALKACELSLQACDTSRTAFMTLYEEQCQVNARLLNRIGELENDKDK